MEANHPHLTTAKSFYVKISRARDRAELVTDDAAALRERLQMVTGECISALEGIGESVRSERGADRTGTIDRRQAGPEATVPQPGKGTDSGEDRIGQAHSPGKAPEPPYKGKRAEMDLGL